MIILSWKIRGMNEPNNCRVVRRVASTNNVDILALYEIRVKESKVNFVRK